MALQKEIELENGVKLNYHRIVSLNKITNMSNTIEVNSYTSMEQREKEKAYQALQKKNINEQELSKEEKEELNKGIDVLIEADFITMAYKQSMTIQQAYAYLKTLEKYRDSQDI